METKDVVTLIIACLGLALSIFNTLKAHAKDKVKLRIKPGWGLSTMSPESFFSVEVVNLSSFPVTIVEVGVESKADQRRMIGPMPPPGTLEPRTSAHVNFPPQYHRDPLFRRADWVYARTACGTIVRDSGVKDCAVDVELGRIA
jgi:hypothetical protein